mmetsp:Transcript_25994/g.41738  ORF Transcript_25994/g.41738 Transcript_25994/m.41738 type:complete len:299 (-) Transcript_25994:183-1079(-)
MGENPPAVTSERRGSIRVDNQAAGITANVPWGSAPPAGNPAAISEEHPVVGEKNGKSTLTSKKKSQQTKAQRLEAHIQRCRCPVVYAHVMFPQLRARMPSPCPSLRLCHQAHLFCTALPLATCTTPHKSFIFLLTDLSPPLHYAQAVPEARTVMVGRALDHFPKRADRPTGVSAAVVAGKRKVRDSEDSGEDSDDESDSQATEEEASDIDAPEQGASKAPKKAKKASAAAIGEEHAKVIAAKARAATKKARAVAALLASIYPTPDDVPQIILYDKACQLWRTIRSMDENNPENVRYLR